MSTGLTARGARHVELDRSARKERYAQARARGEGQVEAYKQSGFKIAAGVTNRVIQTRARTLEADPAVSQRIEEIKAAATIVRRGELAAKVIERYVDFDVDNPTIGGTNKLAYDIFIAAMEEKDFGNALKAVSFLNDANGVGRPIRAPAPANLPPPPTESAPGAPVDVVEPPRPAEKPLLDSLLDEGGDGCGSERPVREAATAGQPARSRPIPDTTERLGGGAATARTAGRDDTARTELPATVEGGRA